MNLTWLDLQPDPVMLSPGLSEGVCLARRCRVQVAATWIDEAHMGLSGALGVEQGAWPHCCLTRRSATACEALLETSLVSGAQSAPKYPLAASCRIQLYCFAVLQVWPSSYIPVVLFCLQMQRGWCSVSATSHLALTLMVAGGTWVTSGSGGELKFSEGSWSRMGAAERAHIIPLNRAESLTCQGRSHSCKGRCTGGVASRRRRSLSDCAVTLGGGNTNANKTLG
jgi:hypothetical protein